MSGALSDVLRAGEEQRARALPGAARLRVAADVMSGLAYLHTAIPGVKPCTIHRDVKSSNILLDAAAAAAGGGAVTARIGDCGLARDVNDGAMTMTRAAGTPGYTDPELAFTGELTPASDIYSFGVVLLELLTARPVDDSTQRPRFLAARLCRLRDSDEVAAVADPAASLPVPAAMRLCALAVRCIAREAAARPTSAQITSDLQEQLVALRAPSERGGRAAAAALEAIQDRDCIVCMERERATRLQPCLHAILCLRCARDLAGRGAGCPYCDCPIAEVEAGQFDQSYAP